MFSRSLGLALIASAALAVCSVGCANYGHKTNAGSLAPGLVADDKPSHNRRLVNPNAQYAVLETAPKLVPRSTALDAASAQPCLEEQLSVSEIAAQANNNFHAVQLAFANHGAAPCKLGGYPQISLRDASGAIIGNISIEKTSESALSARLTGPLEPVTAAAQPSPEVVLSAHSTAAFQIGWTTGPDCPTVSTVMIAAPGVSKAFTIQHPLTVCEGRIQITALREE